MVYESYRVCILLLSVDFVDSLCIFLCFFFFFKQKTAYEMRISDWSSDVCSSDLPSIQYDPSQTALGLCPLDQSLSGPDHALPVFAYCQIGRASCRERVCQYV